MFTKIIFTLLYIGFFVYLVSDIYETASEANAVFEFLFFLLPVIVYITLPVWVGLINMWESKR